MKGKALFHLTTLFATLVVVVSPRSSYAANPVGHDALITIDYLYNSQAYEYDVLFHNTVYDRNDAGWCNHYTPGYAPAGHLKYDHMHLPGAWPPGDIPDTDHGITITPQLIIDRMELHYETLTNGGISGYWLAYPGFPIDLRVNCHTFALGAQSPVSSAGGSDLYLNSLMAQSYVLGKGSLDYGGGHFSYRTEHSYEIYWTAYDNDWNMWYGVDFAETRSGCGQLYLFGFFDLLNEDIQLPGYIFRWSGY
jgi:hypothetical protein